MKILELVLNAFVRGIRVHEPVRLGLANGRCSSLLFFAILTFAHTSAEAAFGDCRDWKKERYKDFAHCRSALDKQNHKNAVIETAKRPRTIIRNRPSSADAQREHAGKTRGYSHFTAKPSASGKAASKENSMGLAKGYYPHRLKTGDPYLKSKQVGAHGNKREILVPRKDVRKDKNSGYMRYKK